MLEALRHLVWQQATKLKIAYNRTVPVGDLFVDRWEKARFLDFGEGSSIYDSTLVIGKVVVGENTWIGPFVVLDGSGGLVIGSHCDISAGAQIYTHDTVKRTVSGKRESIERASTRIGDCCYIGPNAIISKGVVIGERCIIGANSLVSRDVPPDSKAYGSPAVIKPR